jgi:hypothetical protein
MTGADPAARRQAWLVTCLLAAALAAAACFGINHSVANDRARYLHCRAAPADTQACRRVEAAGMPGRPGTVWVFGALAAVFVVTAGGVAVRSVKPVLRELEPVLH